MSFFIYTHICLKHWTTENKKHLPQVRNSALRERVEAHLVQSLLQPVKMLPPFALQRYFIKVPWTKLNLIDQKMLLKNEYCELF